MKEDRIFILGKRCIRSGCVFLGVLIALLFVPGIYTHTMVADDIRDNLVTSDRAHISLALRQNIVNYLPTDSATMLVNSDNKAGYLLTVEQGNLAREGLFSLSGKLGDIQRTDFSLTELGVTTQEETLTISVTPVFYRPTRTMFEIEYMQEMTPEICDASSTPPAFLRNGSVNTDVPETTLIDSRDGSRYTVRKLADGNCWMTQNLRLNLGDRTLTSSDTDIPQEVILSERKEIAEERTIKFEDDPEPGTEGNPIYLDDDSYYGITGENADAEVKDVVQMSAEERAARAKARAEQELWNEDQTTEEGMAIKKISASEAMRRAGAADILSDKDARDVVTELLGAAKTELSTRTVTNYTFRPDRPTQTVAGARWGSSQPTEAETNIPHSQQGETEEYGNYYNWYSATVGTGTYYMSTKTASATICPKGWTLPNAEGANSFARIVEIYKLNESTPDVDALSYMTSDPVSFTISGIYYYNGLIGGQNEWGGYWTAEASNLVAATFSIDAESTEQNYNHKTMGFPVRCVVKQ